MSNDNVVYPNFLTKLDVPVDHVLDRAKEANMTEVVVIGFDANDAFYFAASKPGGHDVLWLIERAKHKLMKITDDLEDGTC